MNNLDFEAFTHCKECLNELVYSDECAFQTEMNDTEIKIKAYCVQCGEPFRRKIKVTGDELIITDY